MLTLLLVKRQTVQGALHFENTLLSGNNEEYLRWNEVELICSRPKVTPVHNITIAFTCQVAECAPGMRVLPKIA